MSCWVEPWHLVLEMYSCCSYYFFTIFCVVVSDIRVVIITIAIVWPWFCYCCHSVVVFFFLFLLLLAMLATWDHFTKKSFLKKCNLVVVAVVVISKISFRSLLRKSRTKSCTTILRELMINPAAAVDVVLVIIAVVIVVVASNCCRETVHYNCYTDDFVLFLYACMYVKCSKSKCRISASVRAFKCKLNKY